MPKTLALVPLVALVLLFALTPGVAHAHAAFVAAQPEPGQRLPTAPGVVVLRFTEPINGRLSRASVTDPSGQRSEGRASGEQEIQVPLSTNAPGIYEVDWTTVSIVDGHTLHGAFQFGVRVSPSEAAEGSTGVAPQWPDLLIAAARTLEYSGLLMAVGMLLLQRLARREPVLDWVHCRLGFPLALAFIAGVLVVLGEAFVAAGSPSADALVAYLASGLPGAARLLRLVAEGLALQLAMIGVGSLAVPLGVAVLALAAAGHAAAVRPGWWGITADALHLLAAGLWAGGILALATLRPPGGWRGSEAWKLLQRFSPVALSAFLLTVGFGIVRSLQELRSPGDLLSSSYGQVLAVKVLAVLAMVPLSFVAWRRRSVAPRVEAPLAVCAIAAAALLAAHPLPPARAGEAEEAVSERSTAVSALPEPGDLTLAGNAGQVLAGLMLRPGQPGRNELLVYLLPLEGEAAAAGIPAQLAVDGRSLDLQECGPTCRSAELDLEGGERLEVRVPTEAKGGTAVFEVPDLPAPDGAGLLDRVQARMHALQRFRLDETLGPVDPPIRTTYAFQTPNRMRYDISNNGSQLIWIGGTRYSRAGANAPWQVEPTGATMEVPAFVWDTRWNAPSIAARVVGVANLEGLDTRILSFFQQVGQLPIWFRLWVDSDGLVHRAEMRAQGHFMDHRYYDFDAPFTIEPPVG